MPTADEIEVENVAWAKYLQRNHYIKQSQGKTLNGQKPIKLQVKNDGLIRCYERLSKLTEETINPILLPTKGKTIELLIEDHHKKTERMGVLIYLCFFELIYLEGTADLSGKEFLLALHRFIARARKVQQNMLDKAPQFRFAMSYQ